MTKQYLSAEDAARKAEWLKAAEKIRETEKEIEAYLLSQFPDCEWKVFNRGATGSIQMHRSNWEVLFKQALDDSWRGSLIIKNIDVIFNATEGKTLENAVTNLKRRLKLYSQQFGRLAK